MACSIKVSGIFGDLLFGEFCGKSFQSMPVDDVNYYLYASVHFIRVYTTSTCSLVIWPCPSRMSSIYSVNEYSNYFFRKGG